MLDQAEIHKKCTSNKFWDRWTAVNQLEYNFPILSNKDQAWQDLHRLTQDEDIQVQQRAAEAIALVFSEVPDKDQMWRDLYRLTKSHSIGIRLRAAEAIGSAFSQVPDKDQAWQDLHRLTQDEDIQVRQRAAEAIALVFSEVPDKDQMWRDLTILAQDKDFQVRRSAAKALKLAFSQVPDKDQVWQDLHRLTQSGDSFVRQRAAEAIGSAFSQVPDKDQAWQDLHRLTQSGDSFVRQRAAEAIGSAFSQVPDRDQAWQDLHRLTQDEDSGVRMSVYHSLGRASIFKATEANDKITLKEEFEAAIAYFEKSSQESIYSPARFCYPFYRTYFAITFKEAKRAEVQHYLDIAKNAVYGSRSKYELLEAVNNLARALQKSQLLKNRSFDEVASELNAYRWYCEKAAEHMAAAEDRAPGAVELMRKGNPLLEERIQATIEEIQDIAMQICQVTTGRGPGAESFCGRINDAARSLPAADLIEILKIISDFDSILKEKCVLLPEGERELVHLGLNKSNFRCREPFLDMSI